MGPYGNKLLDWLQNLIFPEELKYRDRDYATTAAYHFFGHTSELGARLARLFLRLRQFQQRFSLIR